MIGHWPDPLPGELLYSVAARYQMRVGYPSLKDVVTELFGHGSALATVDLPRGIDHLIASLPPGHRYTADGLINAHTSFPFYAQFLPIDRCAQVRADMRAPHGAAALLRAGIIAGGVPSPEFLRTCPCCDAENQAHYGETYWHRLHQLTGIQVCSIHQVFLEDTDARRRHTRTRHGFVAAQTSRLATEARPIDPDDPHHRCLLRLACAAQQLFEYIDKDHSPGLLPSLCARYGRALAARNLTGINGRSVRWPKVRAVFAAHFSAAFLHTCGSEMGGRHDWLTRLLRSKTKAQAPLRHLLFMDAFGLDVSGSKELDRPVKEPFGRGPWPCYGPVCSRYGQPVITSFRVERGGKSGFPVAIFACDECGFTYGRAVQKNSRHDEPFDFIRDHGGRWRQTLVRLWADKDVSLRAIARALHADPLTVKRHAMDLGLIFPRLAVRPSHCPHSPHRPPGSDRRKRPANAVLADRRAWQRVLSNLPGAGTTQFRVMQPALFARLYRSDRAWLRKHTGAPVLSNPRSSRVNWLERDRRLADLVIGAASRLKTVESCRPQIVSRLALARAVKAVALIQHHPGQLPLTVASLTACTENRVDYALRRVTWAVRSLFEELRWHIPPLLVAPRLWTLARRAGLRAELLRAEPRVRDALTVSHADLLARLARRGMNQVLTTRAA